MRQLWTSLACVVIVAMAMVGCGGDNANGGPPPENMSPGHPTTQIAVIPKGLSHQFWLTVKAGAEAAATENDAVIFWQGPAKETEVTKQIDIVQDMISRKVDGIVLAACDENALVPQVEIAMAAGIPVVTFDSGVKSDLPKSFVATDNIAGAKAAADALAEMIGEAGTVGLIAFVPGAATSELREQGFKEGIAAYPNVTLLDTYHCYSDVAKAMDITQDMITANPNLKGIFASNEPAAIGAAQAIKAAGKAGEIKVVAFDASEDEIAALKDGSVQALIVQDPFRMGYEGVKAIIDIKAGKTVEKRIDTGVTVVTMDNFEQPDVQKLLFPI